MRLIGLATALNPVTVVALSISGRGSSLDTREWPSFAQTYESLAELGVVNGTGCIVNGDEQAEQRRAETDRSCGNQQQQVDAALAQCAQLANRAAQDAKDGTSPLFQQYFKSNDANTRNRVAQSYAKIAAGCGHDGNQPIRVECTPTEPCFLPQNNGELAAIADIRSGGPASIRLCRQAFNMPAGRQRRQNQGQGCTNVLTTMGELLVHEMAHATVAANDVTYGKRNCKSLSTAESLNNADNYALLAGDIAKNCGPGPGNGNGNNGGNESPNGGNSQPPLGFPGNNGGPSNRPSTNGPSNNGPSNNKPSNNGFPNNGPSNNGFPNNGFPNNGPSNNKPSNNGPPTNRPSNNGPPTNFPDFDNQFSNNNNFQPGGNNDIAGLDPSIISSIVGSIDFEVVPAGK